MRTDKSAWVSQLQAEFEREAMENAAAEEKVRLARQSEEARHRLTPLQDRLARLLATIPDEMKKQGLSLPVLQASLRGRSRGLCHPGELGDALRRLGFRRVRSWQNNAGFQAVWRRDC